MDDIKDSLRTANRQIKTYAEYNKRLYKSLEKIFKTSKDEKSREIARKAIYT